MIANIASVVAVGLAALCMTACGGAPAAAPAQTPASASVTAPPVVEVSEEPLPGDDPPGSELGPNGRRTPGGISSQAVLDVVTRAKGPLQACFEAQLDLHPGLAGTVHVAWRIAPDGKVASAALESSTVNNAEVESCLVAEVKKLEFPRAPDGKPSDVHFPFVFKAAAK